MVEKFSESFPSRSAISSNSIIVGPEGSSRTSSRRIGCLVDLAMVRVVLEKEYDALGSGVSMVHVASSHCVHHSIDSKFSRDTVSAADPMDASGRKINSAIAV